MANPIRMCVSCRERREKVDFVRVVRSHQGVFSIDKTAEGRGAYVCNNEKCLDAVIKKRGFNRAFKCSIPHEIYEALGD